MAIVKNVAPSGRFPLSEKCRILRTWLRTSPPPICLPLAQNTYRTTASGAGDFADLAGRTAVDKALQRPPREEYAASTAVCRPAPEAVPDYRASHPGQRVNQTVRSRRWTPFQRWKCVMTGTDTICEIFRRQPMKSEANRMIAALGPTTRLSDLASTRNTPVPEALGNRARQIG
jgi:hypothetical protein